MLHASPIQIFVIYAREDLRHLQALEKHCKNLERQKEIEVWHDKKLIPSTEWEPELLRRLRGAHIVMILVTPSFMASDFIHDVELEETYKRQASDGVKIVPVLGVPSAIVLN